MTLCGFWRFAVIRAGFLGSAWRLPHVLTLIFLWSWSFGLLARSGFQKFDPPKSMYWEQYELSAACSADFQHYGNKLPCKKCRIVPAGDGQYVTLFAEDPGSLQELRSFVESLDRPSEQLMVTFCCLLVQEHQMDRFFATVMNHPQIFYRSWQEGLLQLLSELQHDGGVVVLATPKLAVEVGHPAELIMHDEALMHLEQKGLENYALGLELYVRAYKRGDKKFLLDLEFLHQLCLKSDGGMDPRQRKKLKTQLSLERGETGFLGSAGHWGLVQEEGRFNALRILPSALVPALEDKRQLNTELILLVGIE